MYGVIKTHKENNPVRPIISSVGSCSYFLSKWLLGMLNPLIGTISNSHIKNNTDLVDRLNDVSVPYEFKLVSFDVTSLFTKVPLFDLLNFLSHELDNCNIPINKNESLLSSFARYIINLNLEMIFICKSLVWLWEGRPPLRSLICI